MGARLKEMLHETCTAYEWGVEALEVLDNHVHPFVSCPPRWAPAEMMNTLKSLTARALFEEFPQLRKSQWGGKLCADGYYVGSSGEKVTSELIQRYIRYQKAEAHSPRQLSVFDLPAARRSRPKPK